MEIILLFVLFLGVGEIASEDVPQPSWTYEPKPLIEYSPREKNLSIIIDEKGDTWLVPNYMNTNN